MRRANLSFCALTAVAVLVPTLLTGCNVTGTDEFVDLEQFEQIPALEALDVTGISPAETTELWELRESMFGESHTVVLAGGTVGRGGMDPALLVSFDELTADHGFGNLCLPGHCFYYFASVQGPVLETWNTAERVRAFFGQIDTREEAILLALAEGYYWGDEKETAAVRESGSGWELVVISMVRFCDPVQTDRYLLRVLPDGTLDELKSEVWRRIDGVCI